MDDPEVGYLLPDPDGGKGYVLVCMQCGQKGRLAAVHRIRPVHLSQLGGGRDACITCKRNIIWNGEYVYDPSDRSH